MTIETNIRTLEELMKGEHQQMKTKSEGKQEMLPVSVVVRNLDYIDRIFHANLQSLVHTLCLVKGRGNICVIVYELQGNVSLLLHFKCNNMICE